MLVQKNKDVPYHSIAQPLSRSAVLNNRHAYFLLVDNGTVGKYGAELALRRKLERFVSLQKLNASKSRKHPYWTHCSTPMVCLVIEGGTNTVRSVLGRGPSVVDPGYFILIVKLPKISLWFFFK